MADLSIDLLDKDDWSVGILKTFDIPLDVTAFAIEPISRLLAVGTSSGGVHIFGRSGVECKIDLPQPVEVRFLEFSISTFNVVCLDGASRLHVYSLSTPGKPRFIVTARFDEVNSMTLSPSHSHVFLAMQDGNVKTFDLTCIRKSSYYMPNLWKLYEDDMASNGVPSLVTSDSSSTHTVDVVIHPRNLDLLFIAYAGGIVLTDLTERSTIRTYELTLAPGAPGGSGYNSHDILTHRKPMVTCLTIHPSGHFFASGYHDGSIAFWAVEDDNKPLLVRTLDTLDVDILDPQHLEILLFNSGMLKDNLIIPPEPIFKLSWSGFPNSPDPRGGETTLTILGGLTPDKPPGLTVFVLPPFNPSEPPPDIPPASSIHPFFRVAIQKSLTPRKTFFYETGGIVQDYILLPHSTPHFAGNYDPYAILLITEINALRTVEAYQFPPKGLLESFRISIEQEVDHQEDSGGEMTVSPVLLNPTMTAASLRTPFCLSVGNSGLIGGYIFHLSNESYKSFVAKTPRDRLNLDLKAGYAYTENTHELKLLKYHPHHILVTWNRDLTIRFFDFSSQLLLPNAAVNSLLDHDWPEAVPGFTIQLHDIFHDARTSELLMTTSKNAAIDSANFASQAMELALTLKSGEVLVYQSLENRSNASLADIAVGGNITLLDHIPPQPGSRLAPYFLLVADKGPISTCALSDIGFLAIAYQNGALVVIDMRGPRVIYTSQQKTNSKSRYSVKSRVYGLNEESGTDIIQTMTWSICSLHKDLHFRVRLITVHRSGEAEVHTLKYSTNPISWSVVGEPTVFKASPDPVRNAAFVLDLKTGSFLKADRERLSASITSVKNQTPVSAQCFLVAVGTKGARSILDVTGEKIGKVEWGHKFGNVETAQVIEHMDSRALIVQTDKHDGLVYSLPYLEYICTLKLASSSPALTMDENGDFIAYRSDTNSGAVHNIAYGSLFSVRRTCIPPDIDFTVTRGTAPAQPQPISLGPASLLGTWFSYNKTLSGDNVDDLLGGSDRPVPNIKSERSTTGVAQEGVASGTATAGFAAQAAAVQSNIYNKLTSAMGERGQLLGDLEERFNSLEQGSRNMVAQAKRLAAQQTAKSWFGF